MVVYKYVNNHKAGEQQANKLQQNTNWKNIKTNIK